MQTSILSNLVPLPHHFASKQERVARACARGDRSAALIALQTRLDAPGARNVDFYADQLVVAAKLAGRPATLNLATGYVDRIEAATARAGQPEMFDQALATAKARYQAKLNLRRVVIPALVGVAAGLVLSLGLGIAAAVVGLPALAPLGAAVAKTQHAPTRVALFESLQRRREMQRTHQAKWGPCPLTAMDLLRVAH